MTLLTDANKPLTDTDRMPFGRHQDSMMMHVPAAYLAWLKDDGCTHPGVMGYIRENWSAILCELPDRIRERGER